MKKIVLLFFTFVFIVVFGWLYFYAGFGHYLRAMVGIYRLGGQQRTEALQDFAAAEHGNMYGGILAGIVNTGGDSEPASIWVWGRTGLRRFFTGQGSVYSFLHGCAVLELKEQSGDIGQTSIEKIPYAKLSQWEARVKPGHYVLVRLPQESEGLDPHILREIWAYDWWFFLPGSMERLCVR